MENKIIHGDCLEVLDSIPNESIGLCFTDPPYYISSDVVIKSSKKFKRSGNIKYDFGAWDHFNSVEEYLEWCYKWIDKCVRVLMPGRLLCCYFDIDKVNFISQYLQNKYQFKVKQYYACLKSNPVPEMRKVKWRSSWEIIGMYQKPGQLVYNWELGQTNNYEIYSNSGHNTRINSKRVHPTQKNIQTAEKFILYWTNPGDTVLDPFCGSGTTLKAAQLAGRGYIGIEKEEKYYKIACQRLSQNNLFNYIDELR